MCVECQCQVQENEALCDDGTACTDDGCLPEPGCPFGGTRYGERCLLAALSDEERGADEVAALCTSAGGTAASAVGTEEVDAVLAAAATTCGAGATLWAETTAGVAVLGPDGLVDAEATASACLVCALPAAGYSCTHTPAPGATGVPETCNGVDDDCDGDTDEAPGAGEPALCDDGDACTIDTCDADGACSHDEPVEQCDDGVDCTLDICDPAVGCVHTPDDGACDDHIDCTGETCSATEGCLRTLDDAACDDGAACSTDSCTLDGGCGYALDPAACDDGIACTTDTCTEGTGCANTPVDAVCDDGNPCTVDTCVPGTGCVSTAALLPCDDGDACTVNDQCAGGACQPGTPRVCDDKLPCTADACDPATGCVAPPEVPCDYAGDLSGYYEGTMDGSGTVALATGTTLYWRCTGTVRAVIDERLDPPVQSVGEGACFIGLAPVGDNFTANAFVPGSATGTLTGTTIDLMLDVQGVAAAWAGTITTAPDGTPLGASGTTSGVVNTDDLIGIAVDGLIKQFLELFAPATSPYTLTVDLVRKPVQGTCCRPSGCGPDEDHACVISGGAFLADDVGECCAGKVCTILSQTACEAAVDTLFVPSVSGACCHPGGCDLATVALCDRLNGTHTKDATCADANADGYPDLCGVPAGFGYDAPPGCDLDGDTLSVDVGGVTSFDLVSTWVAASGGYDTSGEVTLDTALGDVTLPGGSTVHVGCGDPFTLLGQIPGLPALSAWPSIGVATDAPSLTLGYGFGYELLAMDLEGPFADGRPYVFAAADTGVQAQVGAKVAVNISEGDFATVAIDPTDPGVIVEVGGAALSEGTGKLVKSVGIGLSHGGNLTWRSAIDLYDGSGFAPMQMSGHIWRAGEFALVPIAGLPANVFVDGEIVVRATDAVDHIAAILESFISGDPQALASSLAAAGSQQSAEDVLRDLAFAGNANSIRLEAGPLEIEVGKGAFRYDGGVLYFNGEGFSPGAALAQGGAGKLFEAFRAITIQQAGRAWGFVDSSGFRVTTEADLTAGPFSLQDVRLIIDSDDGIRIEGGSFKLDFAAFLKFFETLVDCDFSSGGATCSIAGIEVATVNGGLDEQGFRFEMSAGVPVIGNVDFSARVASGGSFSLQGVAETGIPGFQTASASVTIEQTGFGVSTTWSQLGQTIELRGDVGFGGSYFLQGFGGVEVLGFPLSGMTATLSSVTGFELKGSLEALTGSSFDATLTVAKDLGTWILEGAGKMSVLGYELASMNATASSDSLSLTLSGKVDVGPVKADLSGQVTPSQFELKGTSNIEVGGFKLASAQVGRVYRLAGRLGRHPAQRPLLAGHQRRDERRP